MVYYDSCSARDSHFCTLHQLRPSAACFISVHHSLALKPCKLRGFRLALEIFIQLRPVLYFNIIQAAFSIPFGKKNPDLSAFSVWLVQVLTGLGGTSARTSMLRRCAPHKILPTQRRRRAESLLPDARADIWNTVCTGFKFSFSGKSN